MKKVFLGVVFVLALNFLLNLWVLKFNGSVKISDNYWYVDHYFTDAKSVGGSFDLLRSWGQTDSQWYLKIADKGYGKSTKFIWTKNVMEGLTYAFFPLYPLVVRFLAFFTNWNFELAAFILSNLLMVADWVSINYVVGKLFSPKLSFYTACLMLLFPFSLFLRSYHAEGLYLLELIWWLYFLTKKKMLPAAYVLAALNITKGTGWLLNIIFLYFLFKEFKRDHLKKYHVFIYMFIAASTVFVWMMWVYFMTGDALFFYKAVSQWKLPGLPAPAYNILRLGLVVKYAFRGLWVDVLQIVVFIASVWILVVSKKWLKPEWWWTSFFLLAMPTLTTYSVGYTSGRLAVLQLPLWVYLTHRLGKRFSALAFVFIILLFWGSLYFVNWYWWG